jgi:phage RecT family recombinase
MHFAKLISESAALQEATKLSLYGCFMDVAVNGLSFDPSFKHLYVVAFSNNVGTKQNPKWEKRAQIMVGGQGELLLRIKQGHIKHADNPVLVYEGDSFKFGTRNDKAFVEHESNLTGRTGKILACYVRLTRNDGSIDYKIITQDDMARFRKFSKDPNSKAWVDGEAGMWQAKTLKHAFRNYPKLRVGDNSTLATETIDTEVQVLETIEGPAMVIPAKIDYGLEETETVETEEIKDDSFVNSDATKAATKTVSHKDDNF